MRKGLLISLGMLLGIQWWQPVQASAALNVAGVLFDQIPASLTIQQLSPNDPLYSQQSYLSQIGVSQAWSTTTGGSAPVAIIDTGIDQSHEDLAGKLWTNSDEVIGNGIDDDGNGYIDDSHGYNFVSNNSDISDTHGHGTGIASIIAAQTNNSKGIAGVNWSAPLMILKALNSYGGGDFPTVSTALRYAVNNGARIVNMSFGAYDYTPEMTEAVNYATSHNVVIVAAVGNGGSSSIYYPAAYSDVIAVSSIGSSNQLSTFSNYGAGTDLAAPGENILMAGSSANGVNRYVTGSGSSFSAAEVTGIVSLLLARYSSLTPTQVSTILKTTADQISGDPSGQFFGAGRVNAAAALTYHSQTLSANLTLSSASALADGTSTLTVTARIVDDVGQPQSNLSVDLSLTGSANIVNRSLLPAGATQNIGTTDSQGNITFTVSSAYAETKRLSLFSGANSITGSATNLIFRSVLRSRYTMRWLQQSSTVTMSLGDTATLWVDVQNTGNVAWVSDRKSTTNKANIRLGTDRPLDRDSSFYDTASWPSRNRSGYMTPEIVRPGETARFNFTVRSSQNGNFREYFRPVIDYVTWLNDLGIYWDIRVSNPNQVDPNVLTNQFTSLNSSDYSADIRGKTNDLTLSPGQTAGVWVDLVNTGSAAWMAAGINAKGTGAVKLGTALPRDRISALYSSLWLSANRAIGVGTMVPTSSTLELAFTIKAPATPGVYHENFQLVSEYVGWFGPVFGWTITVK